MKAEQINELKERLEGHKKTCREWKLSGKDYDENIRVLFFCSEIEAKYLLSLMEKFKKEVIDFACISMISTGKLEDSDIPNLRQEVTDFYNSDQWRYGNEELDTGKLNDIKPMKEQPATITSLSPPQATEIREKPIPNDFNDGYGTYYRNDYNKAMQDYKLSQIPMDIENVRQLRIPPYSWHYSEHHPPITLELDQSIQIVRTGDKTCKIMKL